MLRPHIVSATEALDLVLLHLNSKAMKWDVVLDYPVHTAVVIISWRMRQLL